jgi:hypothetical protein
VSPAADGQPRGAFNIDPIPALAELKLTWGDAGYSGFSVDDDGTWSALTSAGDMLTGDTVDELNRAIRSHWQGWQ